MRRSIVTAFGAAAAACARAAAVRRSRPRRDGIDEPEVAQIGDRYPYPTVIHRIEGFQSVHSASLDSIREVLPSRELHPLRLPNGRALVGVGLFQKRAATAGSGAETVVLPPYAELPIVAFVSRRALSPTASVLALLDAGRPDLGAFPLQFPLTSRAWRDAGRAALGFPAFVADFDLDLSDPEEMRLRVSEEGDTIVSVRARPGGRLGVRRERATLFGALDGRLMACPMRAAYVAQQRWGGGAVAFDGDHPVGAALRSFDIAPRAIATIAYRSGWVIVHTPLPMDAAGPYPAHEGMDTALGRYTIRYPGTPPIDQYEASDARVVRVEAPVAPDLREAVQAALVAPVASPP